MSIQEQDSVGFTHAITGDSVTDAFDDVVNGDNNSDEYKAGTVDDLESAHCNVNSVNNFINNTNLPSILYNKLTTAFQPLAEDISKRPE